MMRSCHLLMATMLLCLVSARAQEVTFSASGGFYDQSFDLTLSCDQCDKVIRYTTNGNMPTANDPIYQAPLHLNEDLYSRSNIYTIQNCPADLWYQPESVQKCIVIRAAAFDAYGRRVGNVATNSYFIRDLGCDTHGLPVMSLCADSLDLFDYERGILVPGIHYDPTNQDYSGNYYQNGSDWERPCNVEFYENDNYGINQQAGVRTQGLSTRRFSQKGLKIYARSEYGKKRFKYKFFSDTDVASFKHLKIKPFKGGWTGIGCQDYISGRIAQNLDIDCLASRPMVLFLNGEYWGIYYLQEKPDERYIEDHYDADLTTVNIIESWDGYNCEYGSGEAMKDLFEWVKNHDLSDDDNYQYVKERIDIDNFIDYEIFEIFSANLDWPANNMRCWQADNGRWRWLFYDGDACFYHSMSDFDTFANATYAGEDYYPSNKMATLFFRKLMENETFMLQFIKRFNQLLNTAFAFSNTEPIFNEAYSAISEEIPNQSNRFGNPESARKWEKRMSRIRSFLSNRKGEIDNKLRELYLASTSSITFNSVYPSPSHNEILAQIDVNIEVKKIVLVDIQIFDITGRQYYFATQAVGAGVSEISIPSPTKPNIYIIVIGGKGKKYMIPD